MKSANAPFNEFGQSMILRDIEDLYIDVDKINASLFGLQTGSTSLSQQIAQNGASIATNTASIATLQTHQTTDEAAIAALQASVAAINVYRTAADACFLTNSAPVVAGLTFAVANTATGGMASSYNTTTGIFTAANTGVYNFNCSVQVALQAGPFTATDALLFLWNETTSANMALVQRLSTLSSEIVCCSASVAATAGNTFRWYVYVSSTSTWTYQILAASIARL